MVVDKMLSSFDHDRVSCGNVLLSGYGANSVLTGIHLE